ncbi:Hsp20/alpha crystallin family protein [Ostreiculturibacter nitratireducens]|uniref:Hsp20/alpha crystallin family protein n=1 Tax=Ostreiculturibacter nitratireducens TaxID=3075226 RepID=UPI0031B5AB95
MAKKATKSSTKPKKTASAPKKAPTAAKAVPLDVKSEPQSRADMLRREFDRLLDLVSPGDWRLPSLGGGFDLRMPKWADWQAAPAVDFTETDTGYMISAELPGMEEDDIEITLSNGVLSIKGEKTEEKEEKEKDYHLSERRYGRFQRSFRLPDGVDNAKIDAKMSNGVLKITLPKARTEKASEKRISFKKA